MSCGLTLTFVMLFCKVGGRGMARGIMGPRAALLALSALLAAAQPSQAQDTPVRWERVPDGDLTSILMPGFASLIGVGGTVGIRCYVVEDGHPFNCGVVAESPAGLGFGSAARLIVASGRVITTRINGEAVPSSMRTVVRFQAASFDDPQAVWSGAAPSDAAMALAGEFVDAGGELPESSDPMDGLDHDRRAVVGPWIEELLPSSPEQERAILVLQVARAFGDDRLRRLSNGELVDWPTDEVFEAACPELTPQEIAAVKELRRRYCERFDCGV